jgi:Galactose oxidase, central domain
MVVERQFLDSAEVYDPTTERFSAVGDMHIKRVCHKAVLLKDGRVLVLGGSTRPSAESAEVYDPALRTFTLLGKLNVPRDGFTVTLLADGQVLIVGGSNPTGTLNSAERFDPVTNTFSLVGSLNTPRTTHTATLLSDGRVLIIGGEIYRGNVHRTAEFYDPRTGTFTLTTGGLLNERHKHAAVALPSGDILVIGGATRSDWQGRMNSMEVFDIGTESFGRIIDANAARFKFNEAVARLSDGRILIAGASQIVELYDPEAANITTGTGALDTDRFYQTATLLNDGRVLIVGGYDYDIRATNQAWLFVP